MDREHLGRSLPRWVEHLRRHLHHRLGLRRAAADLAQEAGARLLDAVERGQEFREPRAWMFRVGHNLAVDELRRRAPRPLGQDWAGRLLDPATIEEEEEPVYTVAGRDYARSELRPLLGAALRGLSAGDRRLLLGRYASGRSCHELARADGVSEDAGKVRLHRARRRLAARIERALREPPLRAACAVALGACAPAARMDAVASAPPLAAAPIAAGPIAAAAGAAGAGVVGATRSPREALERARVERAEAIGLRGMRRLQQLERAAAAYAAVAEQWPDAHAECAQAAFRRGELLRTLGLDAEARGAFLEALDAADAGGGEPWGVRALLELGRSARRSGRRLDAAEWYARAAARDGAETRKRNDAREALAELRIELSLWPAAEEAAAAWARDAESAAEESRALRLRARALRGAGRDAEAESALDQAERALEALAPDASPEGAAAARALAELRAGRAALAG